MLYLEDVSASYGGITALDDVSLHVEEGEVVTLVGANGAGKTTLIHTISRCIAHRKGRITFDGHDLGRLRPHQVVRLGIAECPEGRRVLSRLSVFENLELGAYARRDRAGIRADMDGQFDRFPVLEQRRDQPAGTLSGGEQQMLAIARALMSRPRLLLLDEPSLGLAPRLVRSMFSVIRQLRDDGVTILLVEQNAALALDTADRAYVLDAGRITMTGPTNDLAGDDRVRQAYLG